MKREDSFGKSEAYSKLSTVIRPPRFAVMNLALRGVEADFVLANGSMSSNQSSEGDFRRALHPI